MNENYDYVNIIKYDNNIGLNIKQSSSSGLSGGAISGIIISCVIFILIITILIMRYKKSSSNKNKEDSMIIQIKSIDNF